MTERPGLRPEALVTGYVLLSADGGTFSFGTASTLLIPDERRGADRWVAMDRWPDLDGFVAVTTGGRIELVGVTPDVGDVSDLVQTSAPIAEVIAVPEAAGLWVLDAVGGVFCFGEARYHGSIPGLEMPPTVKRSVAMASTPGGGGYWILDEAGGVFCFGDAEFFGSVPSLHLDGPTAPARGIHATETGNGYVVLEASGVLRAFGDAPDPGPAVSGRQIEAVAFAPGADADAWLVVDQRGVVIPVGTAPMLGSIAGLPLQAEVVDVNVVVSRALLIA